MEVLFAALSITLFFLTVLTLVWSVRDVFLLLNSEDQASLRSYAAGGGGFGNWRKRDRAIKQAWTEHTPVFSKESQTGSLRLPSHCVLSFRDGLPTLAHIWCALRTGLPQIHLM